jgi:hypothetical protein
VVPYEQTNQIILLPVPNMVKKLKMLLKMNEKIKIVPGTKPVFFFISMIYNKFFLLSYIL